MLDKATVEMIAEDYYPVKYLDTLLFSHEFRGPIGRNGYLEMDDLLNIVDWKAQRASGWAKRNDAPTVKSVSKWAFATPNPCFAVHALTYLIGVGVRMATAILTVFDPEKYTVMDVRAKATLVRLDLLADINLDDCRNYRPYLEACKGEADRLGVSLRTLDKCLWVLNGQTPDEFLNRER